MRQKVLSDATFFLNTRDPSPHHSARLHSTSSLQLCTTGTPLDVVETNLHKAGMQIMTIDGFCFDGARFRNCNDGDPMLR